MTVAELHPETILVRNGTLPATQVDNELVILNLATQNYLGLDPIGRRIWEALEQPLRFDALCATLAAHYRGDTETIRADTASFVQELLDEGAVRIAD